MKTQILTNIKDADKEAAGARLACGLEPIDGRTYKMARVIFTTDEGKFRGKHFNEIILDDEAFDTLYKILAPMGVNPNDTDIVVIEQHLDHIDEYDCEHWKVTADVIFALDPNKREGNLAKDTNEDDENRVTLNEPNWLVLVGTTSGTTRG